MCIQFFFRVLLGTVIPLRVRFCRESGGGGRHRAGHVHLFVGESGEDYLSRSVKNSCIDRKLHAEVEQRYLREMMASGEESSEDSENLEELYKRLQVVMDSLPPKCKEIFILGCVEGLSYKDVAEQLGVSVNTVKTQVKVAYKKIKSEFGDHNKNFMLILCNSFFKKEAGK